jgi:signal transduction histidine kinase
MNLLANALKYSDPAKSPRTVNVRLAACSTGPGLEISDNGIGIPPSKLDKIFEQFVRAHAHLDDELGAQGMGLGLAIVRECMDAMGGTVAVESEEGKGTVFTLGWPPEARRDKLTGETERPTPAQGDSPIDLTKDQNR